MHKVALVFTRDSEDMFSAKIDSKIVLFKFPEGNYQLRIGDSLTITLDIPETLHEILEAKICRSAMS